MTRHYCTYFDRRYLPRALLLHESLQQRDADFCLWTVCMDAATYEALVAMKLRNVRPISRDEFERGDDRLVATQRDRSMVEYYFTCTPSVPLWVLNHSSDVESITYVDADLYFYASPESLFDELAGSSVGIVAHRFPESQGDHAAHGIFNVGFLVFRNDDRATRVLNWWRERCIEWCYDRVEDGKYADQRYLDDWPARFDGVKVLEHPGANVAPWNLGRHSVSFSDGRLWSDDRELVFYHFHGVRQYLRGVFDLNLQAYEIRPDRRLLRYLYRPYLRSLERATRRSAATLKSLEPRDQLRETGTPSARGPARYLRAIKGLATRRLVVVLG